MGYDNSLTYLSQLDNLFQQMHYSFQEQVEDHSQLNSLNVNCYFKSYISN